MMDNGEIYVKGKQGKESFYVSRDQDGKIDIGGDTENYDDVNFNENIVGDMIYDYFQKVKVDCKIDTNKNIDLLNIDVEKKIVLLKEQVDILSTKVSNIMNDKYYNQQSKEYIDFNKDDNFFINNEYRENSIMYQKAKKIY